MSEGSAFTAAGGHGAVPTTDVPLHEPSPPRGQPQKTSSGSPLWEVFVRSRRGLAHTHAGSLHAPDAHLALRHARDVFTRRQEGTSIWVVRASDVVASSPDEKDAFFDPAGDKPYRHPTFYDVPDEVQHL